jgi:hypothetical protein
MIEEEIIKREKKKQPTNFETERIRIKKIVKDAGSFESVPGQTSPSK